MVQPDWIRGPHTENLTLALVGSLVPTARAAKLPASSSPAVHGIDSRYPGVGYHNYGGGNGK